MQLGLFLATFLAGVWASDAHGQNPTSDSGNTFLETFENRFSWSITQPPNAQVAVDTAIIPSDRPRSGNTAIIRIQSATFSPELRAAHELPPTLRIDDVVASVWVRSTCPNVRLLLKLVFPQQIDPRTGKPLEAELVGDRYTRIDQWQQLFCSTTDVAFEALLVRLRAQLADASTPIELNTRDVFVSQLSLLFDAPGGAGFLALDDLQLSPVNTPSPEAVRAIPQVAQRPRLQFGNDRILLDGQPFFPLFTTYHGEPVSLIQDSSVNMVWIDDFADRDLLLTLQDAKIGILAQPPRLAHDAQNIEQQSLVPLTADTAPIWAWMLGRNILPSELHYVSNWSTAIRDADRSLPRPLFAEVLGLERQFHRHLSMLGTCEPCIHSAFEPLTTASRLEALQDAALPGKPMFAMIATEPDDARIDSLPRGSAMPILEPEQIQLQGYAALAAGFRGLGFSKRFSFEDQSVGLNERLLAMKLLNLHIQLLEPWLATGRLSYHLEARVDQKEGNRHARLVSRTPLASRWDTLVVPKDTNSTHPSQFELNTQLPIRASVFQTDFGHLILLVAYQSGAQFVPGEGQAENVRILIAGDAVQGWEVGLTEIGTSNLAMTHEAGGTAIHLKKFNQFAAIVISRDGQSIEAVKRRLSSMRRPAAQTALQLAELKLARVASVHGQLVDMKAPPVHDARNLLSATEQLLENAREELAVGHDHDAYVSCQKANGFLRRLQRAHWENTLTALPSPLTSPYTCSFQTLPDHWRLMEKLSQLSSTSSNLLPSGDFENHSELEASWGYETGPRAVASGMSPRLELVQGSIQGEHALAISIPVPTSGLTTSNHDVPLLLVSPEIPCRAGEVLYISGRFKIPYDLDSASGGLAIYDSLLGPTAAARYWKQTANWDRFTLIREVPQDGVLRLHFEIHSPGSVILDDIQIKALSQEPGSP